MIEWLSKAEPIFYFVILLPISVLLGLFFHILVIYLIRLFDDEKDHDVSDILRKRLRKPAFFLFPALAFSCLLATFPNEAENWHRSLTQIARIILIMSVTFAAIRALFAWEDLMLKWYQLDEENNFQARKLITQVQYLRKVAIWVVLFIGFAITLMNFDSARKIGTGLLTSAGVAGIIIGFASQKLLANLLAGIQIAFTQPIKIDDVVIVEGEWGRIEEINLTYVVVKIWDLRRLVLPITYFVEKPFQNWTRTSAQIIGSVFVYADYTVPIHQIRAFVAEAVAQSELWDGQTCNVQVTNATADIVEIRSVMSARNSSNAWDLRCEIREKLIGYLQANFPDSLPKTRVSLQPEEKTATDPPKKKVDKKK